MREAIAQPFEVALGLADQARGRLLLACARPLRPMLLDRQARVALLGCLLVGASLTTATLFPLWMLALAPFVWGVPHLLADLRYLVIRQGLARKGLLLLLIVAAVIAAAQGLGVRASLGGAVALALIWPGAVRKRLLILAILVATFTLALWKPYAADVTFAHAHNFIAVGFWLAWRRRDKYWHFLPLGLFLLATAAILSGWTDAWAVRVGGLVAPAPQLAMPDFMATLASVDSLQVAQRLVILYAFAQGVHYAAWIHLLPQEDRARPVTRGFRSTYVALRADLGPLLLGSAALCALGLAIWATVDLVQARNGYFQLALFHSHMELLLFPVIALRGLRTATAK